MTKMKYNNLAYLLLISAALLLPAAITVSTVQAADQPTSTEDDADDTTKDENAGMEYLDQATETKITASTLDDLERVIRLCDRAKRAGLSKENTEYCDQLKASTQIQRGLVTAQALIESPGRISDWESIRQNALVDLEEAVRVIPDNPQAYFIIAQLNLMPDGDSDRVKSALDLTIEKAGDDDINIKVKAILVKTILEEDKEKKLDLLRSVVKLSPNSASVLISCGASFADAGKLDEAVECIDKAKELEPDNPTALGLLAEIYSRQMKFENALLLLTDLEKLKPEDSVRIMIERARIFAQMDQLDESLSVLEAARAKDPRNPIILIVRASIYITKKDLDNAEKDIDALSRMEITPEMSSTVQRLKIDMLVNREKYDDALELLDKLIKANGESVETSLWKAMILSAKKANSKALAILNELLEKPKTEFEDNEYFRVLRSRGDVNLGLGNHNKAIKDFEEALKLDPDDVSLLNNYAWVLATSPIDTFRDGDLALELAKKAAEKSNYKQAHILSTLGAAYAEIGDFKNAIEWSTKAIEIAEKEKHDRLDDLKKELDSYKLNKPYREIHDEDIKD